MLALLAYGSAAVATLRAGSRFLYLMEHDHIDVMDGPLILGPRDVTILSNGTASVEISPLWELASVFQQSVRLALEPDTMEYRVLSVGAMPQKENDEEKEPYSLSPFPVKKRGIVVEEQDSVETVANESSHTLEDDDDNVDVEIQAEDIVGERSSDRLSKPPSFVSRISMRGMLGKVPLVGRWMGGQQDDSEDDDDSFSFDDMEIDGTYCEDYLQLLFWSLFTYLRICMYACLEWDFDYCMSTDIPYNTSDSAVQWAEITAYAPDTFADLRSRYGIPEEAFRQSILQSGPYVSFQSNSKGAARVGKILRSVVGCLVGSTIARSLTLFV